MHSHEHILTKRQKSSREFSSKKKHPGMQETIDLVKDTSNEKGTSVPNYAERELGCMNNA